MTIFLLTRECFDWNGAIISPFAGPGTDTREDAPCCILPADHFRARARGTPFPAGSRPSARDTSSDHGSVDRDLESAAGGADAAGVLLKSPSRISRG